MSASPARRARRAQRNHGGGQPPRKPVHDIQEAPEGIQRCAHAALATIDEAGPFEGPVLVAVQEERDGTILVQVAPLSEALSAVRDRYRTGVDEVNADRIRLGESVIMAAEDRYGNKLYCVLTQLPRVNVGGRGIA